MVCELSQKHIDLVIGGVCMCFCICQNCQSPDAVGLKGTPGECKDWCESTEIYGKFDKCLVKKDYIAELVAHTKSVREMSWSV